MSKALITEGYLTDIADAIRSKKGVTTQFTPAEMKSAILSIPTGGGATLISKTITRNGTYNAIDDLADGYSTVVAQIPTLDFVSTVSLID